MLSKLKDITLRIVACANAVAVALMLLCGFSDRLNPVGHPLLANAGLAFPLFLFANFCFLVFFLVFRKKYALVSIAGFVAGYQPVRTYCPFNIVRDTPPGAVKVLSYNVRNYGGYGRSRGQQFFDRMKDNWERRSHRRADDARSGGTRRESDWDYNARRKAEQDEIDRILDKVRRSGYDSLTEEEKRKLFDGGK